MSTQDLKYTENYKANTVYVGDFSNTEGKYISIVNDSTSNSIDITDNTRTKIVATFITKKNKITHLKFLKYKKIANEKLDPNPETFTLPLNELVTLKSFCEFLNHSDLESLTSKSIMFGEKVNVDEDFLKKLYILGRTDDGRDLLKTVVEQLVDNSNINSADMIKFGLTVNKIKQRQIELDHFEQTINKPHVKEVSEVQALLKKFPWIFGPEYISYDFRPAGEAGFPDGRLKRVDGLSDILEVKLPCEELLRESNGRYYISPKCSEAIGQLTSYLEHYYSQYTRNRDDITGKERLQDDYGKYYKPKGILLIGRRNKDNGVNLTKQTANNEPKPLRSLLSYFHWIEILTYDDLLERARNGLTNLSK